MDATPWWSPSNTRKGQATVEQGRATGTEQRDGRQGLVGADSVVGVTGTPGRQKNRGGSSGRATRDSGAAMDLRLRFLKHRTGVVFWIIGAAVQISHARNVRS
jgi:hypothetical protein